MFRLSQLSGGGTGTTTPQSNGWTSANVRDIVDLVRAIKDLQDQAAIDTAELLEINAQGVLALYFLVMVLGIFLGYMISHYFIPSPYEIVTS